MSWMKRRGQPSPNTTNPGVPMYNPNQHSNPQQPYQQQWQPIPQQYNNDWYNQSKGPSKTPPIQQYPQQNTNNYWSQSYNQPQQNFNQSLPNQPANQYQNYNQYGSNQQQQQPNYYPLGYQQDSYNQQYMQQQQYYPNQQQQSIQSNSPALINQVPAQPAKQDPWNWDWEDNTNANSQTQNEPISQNTITDSFATDESWNWSVDDTNTQNQNEPITAPKEEIAATNSVPQNSEISLENHIVHQEQNSEVYQQQLPPVQKIDTLEDLPAIQRLKSDNLTPQWSIESQVSQDSSEDVLLTSESDNRSNILSQSSTTSQSPSRPASTHDVQSEYVPHYKYEQEPIHQPLETLPIREEPINSEYYQENSQSCVDSVDKALQELSLNTQFENKEIVAPENTSQSLQEEMPPPPTEPTPPPPQKKSTPPLQPPPVLPSTSDNKNPYKKGPGLSHKSMNKVLAEKQPIIPTVTQNTEQAPPVFLQQSTPSAFIQPILRPADNLGVNLETLPDNSERPDQIENIPPKTIRKTSTVQQQWAENCEIAPINDRNQYLETGQLSDADVPVYNQPENIQASCDNNDSLPPSGLRRLVIGQMEQPESNQTRNTLDEPPAGLSRMVVGSTIDTKKMKSTRALPISSVPTPTMTTVFQPAEPLNNEEPPAGLHRMVPGESSSPESSSYMYRSDSNVFQAGNFDDADNYVSESELNQMGVSLVSQRSATIGADTPPVTNQQTISGTGYSSSSSVDPIPSREGAVGIDNDLKEADLSTISSTVDESIVADNSRREDIDGGPQDEVVTPVRDQTVGQNTTDINISNASQNEKHRNRNYTTDSEHEQPKERHNRSSSPGGRYEKDRRYYDDRRDRQRDRDSPDSRYRGDRKFDKRRPKDKRYEDDTDYYSDKERRRDDREEYERRYSSLRKEKDRPGRRDRRDYRDERDDRRSDYYYQNRYDPEYYNRSSRPSSRSDSMHDSYRERNHRPLDRDRDHDRPRHRDREHERDRDRDHRRRPRDPYNPYYQGYNYDPYNPYYQQYHQQYHQYYENLRRTNPQAYAEWYRKYYQQQGGAMAHAPGYSTEDRASVHSGRSSANEELNKDRYTRQSYYSQQSLPHYYRETQNASTVYTVDDSRLLDNTDSSLILEDSNVVSQRLTPAKFTIAHVKASIASGNLVNILPHYPLDGQPATVEVITMESLLVDDEEYRELAEFPGPLVKGVSHKKTVIEFCEHKIKKAAGNANIQDVESYILMWELLILLLRQNGMVVGTDIAELLMKNRPIETSRRQSISSASSTQQIDTLGEPNEHGARVSPAMQYKEEYITDKFREYLIYGSGKEALEWAMKHGLWGHALFLASKLDKRTYANVMMRFANGLTMNDPLQTLYQLLSGRQPAAVTCVADEKWGDWRPHLAMILSNTSQRPDLDRKAITSLGDTLQQRGSLYAAHFCYLMAQVEFGKYNSPGVKLVLLSSSHHKPFSVFATNEAIFMTEIYEYACGLSDGAFTIPEFQPYKYLMATRMVDYGLLEKSLMYLERVAVSIKQDPSRTKPTLVAQICELADRLKYCDPVQDEGDGDSRADHSWLSDLKTVLNDYNMGLITHQSTSNLASFEPETQQQSLDQQVDQQWQQPQQTLDYYQQQQQQTQQDLQQQWQQQDQQSLDYNNQQIKYQQDLQQSYDANNYQEQYWGQQQQQQQQQNWEENHSEIQQEEMQQQQSDYWNQSAQNEPTEQPKIPPIDEPRPQISMPNQNSKSKNYFDDEVDTATPAQQKPASPIKPKPVPAQPKQASTGWFGGIWSKLALRPKNQMKLPDDKNPTIVWDSEKKRWVNLEEDNSEAAQDLKPPPSMSEMFGSRAPAPISAPAPPGPQSLPAQMPSYNAQSNDNATNPPAPIPSAAGENQEEESKPNQPNMFKLQRGRNIKKAYVDVFNPSGKPSSKGSIPAPEVFGAPAPTPAANHMNFFVPQPVADLNAPTDFLTPQTNTNTEDSTQLSRWSSTSSLSREVQFYMQRPKKQGGVPMMYNPNQFSN